MSAKLRHGERVKGEKLYLHLYFVEKRKSNCSSPLQTPQMTQIIKPQTNKDET